ncbi:MAG: T9SS C-terminal target domain-containing protein [Candidatus Kapaibacterium sp.]|nr:MAG: T9SS C-terminal target domain-containing protein [Candidatus Kapabacteria bacterium]
MLKTSLLLFVLFVASCHAQAPKSPPKREFRGVWIASVSNIDFPLRSTDAPEKQRTDAIAILETHRALGINALFVQIRPAADALYSNAREPWSEWLTGAQGRAPEPAWDPLQFLLDEAHKRNMECHAWFNPFRSVVSANSRLADTHISRTQPAWHLAYGSPFRLLNPGLPEVRAYVLSVIMDVVRRYDIDGVHFDDYFYPYEGTTTQDASTFAQHSRGITNIADWRRDNVNIFVKAVSDSIRAAKKHVKFGISPFGIWRSGTPQGTTGLDAYSVIYCDALAWLQAGTVDYVIPQLYWKFGGGQDYAKLMPWWQGVARSAGRHSYTGLGAYRLTDAAWSADDLTRQIDFNREQSGEGAVWFSSNGLTRDLKGIRTMMQGNQYRTPALPPTMAWKDNIPPNTPQNAVGNRAGDSLSIQWRKPTPAADGDTATQYVLYALADSISQLPSSRMLDSTHIRNAAQILGITRDTAFTLRGRAAGTTAVALTALDRLSNESRPARVSISTSITSVLGASTQGLMVDIFPNPVQHRLLVRVALPQAVRLRLSIIDMLGRTVLVLANAAYMQGEHLIEADTETLAAGVYTLHIEANDILSFVRKVVVQR